MLSLPYCALSPDDYHTISDSSPKAPLLDDDDDDGDNDDNDDNDDDEDNDDDDDNDTISDSSTVAPFPLLDHHHLQPEL